MSAQFRGLRAKRYEFREHDGTLTDQGKRERLNALRPTLQAKIDAAKNAEAAYLKEARAKLESYLFGIWDGIKNVVKGAVNFIIGLINGVIDGLNFLADGVYDISGGSIDIRIPHVPQLAEGGIIRARPGGIIANIGEGRYEEAVVPLSPSVLGQLGGGGGFQDGQTVVLRVGAREFDAYVDELAGARIQNDFADQSPTASRGRLGGALVY